MGKNKKQQKQISPATKTVDETIETDNESIELHVDQIISRPR